MQYVVLLDWRTEATGEERDGALIRRGGWSYPDGLNVIAESWTASSSPAVVVIAEADNFAPLMELNMTWGDVFVITTHAAVSAEEGLTIGPEVMARARA
jgi:hypothetical protein